MGKIAKFSIPLVAACLVLCALFYFLGGFRTARASDSTTFLFVTTLDDVVAEDGLCSLREAIQAANSNTSVDVCGSGDVVTDTIIFNVSGILTATSQFSLTAGGPLVIDAVDQIELRGDRFIRVFYIDEQADVTLTRIILSNGNSYTSGGCIYNNGSLKTIFIQITNCSAGYTDWMGSWPGDGGGIYNDVGGTLRIFQGRLMHNGAVGYGFPNAAEDPSGLGGAIYNAGSLWVGLSTFDDNFAGSGGAAIWNGGTTSISRGFFTNNILEGIQSTGILTVTGSTLSNNAGAIINSGISVIKDTTVNNNGGPALVNLGDMIIMDSTIYSNTTSEFGGGLRNSGTVTITSSTVMNNQAGTWWWNAGGGGIYNTGTAYLYQSTISGNSAVALGGAIYNGNYYYGQYLPATMTINNCTISGNNAGTGGGIANGGGYYEEAIGIITVTNSTLADNMAVDGSNIYNHPGGSEGSFINSIVTNQLLADNCTGVSVTDGGYNIENLDTCNFDPGSGSMPNTDPAIGPLQENYGTTWTHALLDGSPAIDAGEGLTCPPIDQRGVPRPVDGNLDGQATCDIGSYEFEPMAQLVVNTLEDEENSDGDCSLREAVRAANENISVDGCQKGTLGAIDNITFIVSGTILRNLNMGDLYFDKGAPVWIDGGNVIAISGGGARHVLDVRQATIKLENLVIKDGHSEGISQGGGIVNSGGRISIIHSILENNIAQGGLDNGAVGGGILNYGSLEIIESSLINNHAFTGFGWNGAYGGAIKNSGVLTITNSTLSGNSAEDYGGGIYNTGKLTIINSTLSSNSAYFGGGINNGDYFEFGTMAISYTTITSNTAMIGGGIHNHPDQGQAALRGTVIANNQSGENCAGDPVTDLGFNLEDGASCGLDPANGSLPDTEPVLGSLQDNGGPTWTHALLQGSPAIDAGENIHCPHTDQRGVLRPIEGDGIGSAVCDIGSYEAEALFHLFYIPWVDK